MKKKITIVGGGACALMLGCELDPAKFDVTVYEHNAALGRKFLVAGDGGLNLTHSEQPADFIQRYTPTGFLKEAFAHFSNHDFIRWLNNAGIKTIIGSSGRVFPEKGMKPVEVLNVFLEKLEKNRVVLKYKHTWKGFSENNSLLFEHKHKTSEIKSDLVVFCLGGASWPVTGSTGNWLNYFSEKGIQTFSFEASNCMFKLNWPGDFSQKASGKPLKNISIRCGEKIITGEIVITKDGIEGNGIYPLSPRIREQLKTKGIAEIFIDLKPQVPTESIISKINSIKGKNLTQNLRTVLNLNPLHIQLLKSFVSKEDFFNIEKLAQHIKQLRLEIVAAGPLEDAISTVGGISLNEVHTDFELKKLPSHYCVGEMLDYDAPTGGYLLQSCFTMGKYVANTLNLSENNSALFVKN